LADLPADQAGLINCKAVATPAGDERTRATPPLSVESTEPPHRSAKVMYGLLSRNGQHVVKKLARKLAV
jgi:hypothetical protein